MAGKQKEMQFSLRMAEHDRGYRLKRIVEFLRRHDSVLLTVRLRGREMARPDMALDLLGQLVTTLSDVGRVSKPPSHKGNLVQVLVIPK